MLNDDDDDDDNLTVLMLCLVEITGWMMFSDNDDQVKVIMFMTIVMRQ